MNLIINLKFWILISVLINNWGCFGCTAMCAEYDTSQGSEVKEKEKARHHKDDKHAT